MRNVRVAESILCLVTSPDRASSTVGDLTEQAATRGVPWFWSGVLRTTVSLIWCAVAESPLQITGVAFVGLVIGFLATSLWAAIIALVFHFLAGDQVVAGSTVWTILVDALPLLTSLWVGRILARWAPGRELAACLAYAVISSIFIFFLSIFLNSQFVPSENLHVSDELWVLLKFAAQNIPVPMGAIWGRRRRLAAL